MGEAERVRKSERGVMFHDGWFSVYKKCAWTLVTLLGRLDLVKIELILIVSDLTCNEVIVEGSMMGPSPCESANPTFISFNVSNSDKGKVVKWLMSTLE